MWFLESIELEMQLGNIEEYLNYKAIKRKCLNNGIKPRIYVASDGRFAKFGITDEEFDKLFKLKEKL